MLNKLDNKLILDRQFALELLDCLDVNDPDHGQVAQKLHEIMSAQDLTGWAAVLVVPTRKMMAKFVRGNDPLQTDNVVRRHRTMLNASPPLPGGGE